MTTDDRRYKKSSYSSDSSDCVEISGSRDYMRDSKNPTVELSVPNLSLFLQQIRSDPSERFINR